MTDDPGPAGETPPTSARLRWRRCCGCCLVAFLGGVLCLLFGLAGSSAPVEFDRAAAAGIELGPLRSLIPGPGLPDSVTVQASNNNVDLASFAGRTFLAFRTAPHHFASADTRLVLLSSPDREHWEEELQVHVGADLREPRFLVFRGRLFFYYFEGGADAFAFEPRRIRARVRGDDGSWSEPTPVYRPGFVVWRAKVLGDTAYMSVYRGDRMYRRGGEDAEVRLLRSTDGLTWDPISEGPQVTVDGATECAFAFTPAGGLVAVIRLEVQGSLVATAQPGKLAEWTTHYSTHKYDSPLVFRRGSDYYLLARRNVAGAFLRGPEFLPTTLRRGLSLARYSLTRKRTCLYRLDLEAKRPVPLFDLPSRGDTAFPALAALDEERYFFVNYSNPLDEADLPWIAGQLGETRLYAGELRFPR